MENKIASYDNHLCDKYSLLEQQFANGKFTYFQNIGVFHLTLALAPCCKILIKYITIKCAYYID